MPLVLAHVTLEPGARLEEALPADYEAGVYVIDGEARIGQERATTGLLAFLATEDAPIAIANEGAVPLDVMVLGGTPAEGPLVFHGPFVMNSVDQVRAAEIAYRTGRMGQLED
jgi:redox-sensitive bicupin YhaK (pirin superfamily)